jgi:hypothetical protein
VWCINVNKNIHNNKDKKKEGRKSEQKRKKEGRKKRKKERKTLSFSIFVFFVQKRAKKSANYKIDRFFRFFVFLEK